MEYLLHHSEKIEFSEPMRKMNRFQGMFPNSWRRWGDGNSHIFFKGGEFVAQAMKTRTVNWMYDEITLWPMGNLDIVSFEFSGCIMAAFRWDGIWHAAHIQMGGEFPRYMEWGRFISSIRNKLTALLMFRPDYTKKRDVCRRYEIENEDDIRVVGLVATELECFTLYLKKLDDTERKFALLAYKQHYPSRNINVYERGQQLQQSVLNASSRSVWDVFFSTVGESDIIWREQFPTDRLLYR